MKGSLGLLFLILLSAQSTAAERTTIDLIPSDRPSWGIANLFAPITGWFMGGPSYWYGDRKIEIDTTPPGATLELSYVRKNFQKRFERSVSPILLVLPSRIETEARDSVTIRALLDGYSHEEVRVGVRSHETKLMIDLAPLPNTLEAVTHTYFSGRGSLKFLTREALRFRLQDTASGFSIVLIGTSQTVAAATILQDSSSAVIHRLRSKQLGEDLIVNVELDEAHRGLLERRSSHGYDAARDLHHFTVDLVPASGTWVTVDEARDALAQIEPKDVSGCALEFDDSLRLQLEAEALSRALAPASSFLDPYLEAALKRLGEISPDAVISLTDGTKFRPSRPLELSAASVQSSQALGYLALLKKFVANLEPSTDQRNTLRGIIAPGVTNSDFDAILETAEESERRCNAGMATTAGSGSLVNTRPH
jgi:hypothetical protein